MSSVSVRVPAPRRASPAKQIAGGAALLAVALAVMWIIAGWLDGPARVDFIVENPTPYPLNLQVRSQQETSVLPVAVVPRNSTNRYRDVVDHGERWVFEFSYAGEELPPVERSRAELEADGWRVSVPPDSAARLERAGHESPP